MSSDTPSKIEFAIQIKGLSDVEDVKQRLAKIGVKSDQIETVLDSDNKECRMVIQTIRHPWVELHETIESSGKRSVLVGFSDQSAVVMLDKGDTHLKGVIRFCSIAPEKPGIVIDGVIDGLKSSAVMTIREYGDVSQGLSSLGEIYKNSSYNLTPDDSGRATIRTVDDKLQVSELIGRSVAVVPASSESFVCGIISRAAGVFQNWKRICACDGVTIWDERDRPLAGAGRKI